MSNILRNVAPREDSDQFRVGVDWLLPEQGRPYLLEINFSAPHGREGSYSRVQHFLQTSLDKLHQHQIFGDLMPPFTADNQNFDAFKQGRKVVYKSRTGSQGRGVSVLDEPKNFQPDFLEEFIPPRAHSRGDKSFPYIIRSYLTIKVTGGSIVWEPEKTFRKQGTIAIEDQGDSNSTYRLNTTGFFSRAERQDATPEEVELCLAITPEIFRKITEATKKTWDPTKIFEGALIGYYSGYSVPSFRNSESVIEKTVEELRKRGFNFSGYGIAGGLERAIRSAEYGSDLVLLRECHSLNEDDMRQYFEIARSEDRDIVHRSVNGRGDQGHIFERFPSRKNIALIGEKTPEELADLVIKNYRER